MYNRMPAHSKQLKVSNVYGFLSQIYSNSSPDTGLRHVFLKQEVKKMY